MANKMFDVFEDNSSDFGKQIHIPTDVGYQNRINYH